MSTIDSYPTNPSPKESLREPEGHGKNPIMIVDDDPDLREAMREYLEAHGFHVITAESADKALERMQAAPIDLLLIDISMSGMDGLDLTGRITELYDADVIVMTGFSNDYTYEEAIRRGAADFVFKPVHFEEIVLRVNRVLKERKLTLEREEMLAKLQELARTDGLTGLYNSRHFYKQLEKEIERVNRYHHPLSILLMDLDHFKHFNDTFGHLEGDHLLVRIGQIIRSCLRSLDTAYRYGGEEFTVILPETGAEEAAVVAERVRETIHSESFLSSENQIGQMTISIGIAEYIPGECFSTFVQRADKAMYISKKQGRNQITILTIETEADES